MNLRRLLLIVPTVLLAMIRMASAQTAPPSQDPAARLGVTIVAVEVRIEGKPDNSPALAALVDIQPGTPLTPDAWRRVVQKFDQIPQFENVSVQIEDRPGGVALIFDLEPRHPIDSMRFEGNTGVAPSQLDRQIRDRFNGLPAENRRVEVQDEVRNILKNEGYRSATVSTAIAKLHNPDRATMVTTVEAGPLTTVATVDLRLKAAMDHQRTIERLGVTEGAPYRERALAAALVVIRDELRAKQFYTAIAQSQTPTFSDAGTKAHLVITIDAGPLVEIQVNPANGLPGRLDDLIPVKRLSSVDRDLLDESKKKIIEAWQAKGYRHATADYKKSQSPDRLVITYTIDHGRRYRIMGLDLPAGAHIPASQYQQQPALKVGEWFNEVQAKAALDAIKAQYQQDGYYAVKMTPDFPDAPGPDPQTGGVTIRPNVTEGPRGIVTSITFTLSPGAQVTQDELSRHMLLKQDEPYDPAKLVHDRDELNVYYDSRGFPAHTAVITPGFSADGRSVTVSVRAVEGLQVFVGDIIVVGNEHIKTDVILRALPFTTGSAYSEQARLAGQRALSSTLGFHNVRITAEDRLPGEKMTRLIVSVEESSSRTFDLGPGLEAGTHARQQPDGTKVDKVEFAPRAFVSAGKRNLGGRNRSIDGYARVSFKQSNTIDATNSQIFGFTEYRVTGTYHDLDAFRSRTDLLAGVTAEQASRTSYNFSRKIASVDLSRPVRPGVTLLGRYSLETTRRFDEILTESELPFIDRLYPQVRLSIISGAIVWDRRDNALNPTRGSRMSANFEFAMRPLGSEVGFVKSFFEVSYFHPITSRLTFGTRGQVGLANGEAKAGTDAAGNPIEIHDVPASERFYSGGSYSVRGFQVDRLGVREVLTKDNLSTGGNGLFLLNLELRAHVGKLFKRDLGVVAFLDAGNVFKRAGDIDLTPCSGTIGLGLDGRCLRTTAGFGIRYNSWFGPLRLDFGFKTDRMLFANVTERRWEFHLSFGEVF